MDAQASPLFGSLEEAATVATAGQEMDALLSGLRTKHAARRAEAAPSPMPSRVSRQETALRRNQELGPQRDRPAAGGRGGALDAIAANAERLQSQAAQLSLHASTKELLEEERTEWRREVSALKSALKTKDAEVGAMERRCDLLERTCADQAEARDREHNALTTRVAQLELTIELWVTEMTTGLKPERPRTSSASILRANSSSSTMMEAGSPLPLPLSPATAHRREGALQQLKASGDADTMMVAPPAFSSSSSGGGRRGGDGGDGGGDGAEGAEVPPEIMDGAASVPEPAGE